KFTENSSLFFRKCLEYLTRQNVQSNKIESPLLDKFNNIVLADSTCWSVSDGLKEIFPGSGGSASSAGCKIQLCYEYKTGSIFYTELQKGSSPDQGYSKNIPGKIKKNDLVITDLGYWTLNMFKKIHEKEAFFVSRLSTQANLYLKDKNEFVKFEYVDYLKKCNKNSLEFDTYLSNKLKIRVVAFRVPEEKANLRRKRLIDDARRKKRTPSQTSLYLCNWSIFMTNCDENRIPGEMIRSLYRIRWAIELAFKNWKSILNIHMSNVKKNEHRLKCEIYAKLIYSILVHDLYQYVNSYLWNKDRKEISFMCLYKFLVDRNQIMRCHIKKSYAEFIALLKSYIPNILRNCIKNHQPSRETTLQLIDKMIGDGIPTKINKNMLLPFRSVKN
ncbi:MAG: IS4 family transposase, partial [bacterium]|nr:IS4 family transposase [bacterium]